VQLMDQTRQLVRLAKPLPSWQTLPRRKKGRMASGRVSTGEGARRRRPARTTPASGGWCSRKALWCLWWHCRSQEQPMDEGRYCLIAVVISRNFISGAFVNIARAFPVVDHLFMFVQAQVLLSYILNQRQGKVDNRPTPHYLLLEVFRWNG
jgi:hypothetical protein